MLDRNLLLYGDNLPFLTDPAVLPDESVDLIYLDPPFNSAATYNVLFAEVSGQPSAAQIKAFDDTWTWDQSAAKALFDLLAEPHAPNGLKALATTFQRFLGQSPMFAYLVQMAVRLVHMRRVLKPTGSLYLHCDPTASHYLKLVLDALFGPRNFRSEIVWKRTHAHGSARRFGPIHDTIFFYSVSEQYLWADPTVPHDPAYIESHFKNVDPKSGRAFQPITLTGAGTTQGDSGKPWRGVDPTRVRRHWAIPGKVFEKYKLTGRTLQEKLDALDAAGLIYWPKSKTGTPRLKWFIDDLNGAAVSDLWTDIPPISARAAERLGYPTQKPLSLLKRIVAASSRPGDVILDPFCGCGTTIDAVESLNREHPGQPPRRWVAIDSSPLAIDFTRARFGRRVPQPVYELRGKAEGPTVAPQTPQAAKRRGGRNVHASRGLRRERSVPEERMTHLHV